MLLSPLAAASASADVVASGYERTIDLGLRPVDVQLRYGNTAPGATALAGEGSVSTALPGHGQLTLRLPHVVGQSVALGNAQFAASYDLLKERRFTPSLGVVADVDLPTAAGAREPLPRFKATVAKTLGSPVVEAIRLEGELWSAGNGLTPGYRTLVGTTLRLLPSTSGSVELVSLRRESQAQLGLSHRLSPNAAVRAGVAARVAGETNSLRATIGFDRRF
jgi:hypothetical protein